MTCSKKRGAKRTKLVRVGRTSVQQDVAQAETSREAAGHKQEGRTPATQGEREDRCANRRVKGSTCSKGGGKLHTCSKENEWIKRGRED